MNKGSFFPSPRVEKVSFITFLILFMGMLLGTYLASGVALFSRAIDYFLYVVPFIVAVLFVRNTLRRLRFLSADPRGKAEYSLSLRWPWKVAPQLWWLHLVGLQLVRIVVFGAMASFLLWSNFKLLTWMIPGGSFAEVVELKSISFGARRTYLLDMNLVSRRHGELSVEVHRRDVSIEKYKNTDRQLKDIQGQRVCISGKLLPWGLVVSNVDKDDNCRVFQ